MSSSPGTTTGGTAQLGNHFPPTEDLYAELAESYHPRGDVTNGTHDFGDSSHALTVEWTVQL